MKVTDMERGDKSVLHESDDTVGSSSGTTTHKHRANSAPHVSAEALAGGTCDPGFDSTESEEDETGQDARVDEGGFGVGDEEVGEKRDQATNKVAHADGDGRDVETTSWDFLCSV